MGEALLLLDDFPVTEDFGGVLGTLFAEDVGMAANHFFVDFADDVGDGEAALFLSDLGVKEDLEEEIAEFLGKFGVIRGIEGIEDFVGFFDKIRAKRGVSLFAVPRAAARRTETRHERDELFEEGARGARASGLGFAWLMRGALRRFPFRFARSHEPS